VRTSIRNLLLSISLINFFGAAAFCAQAQVRKAEPEPLLLGSGSGTITISKANGQTVATETQFFPFSTGEYYTGAVRIKFTLGNGTCRAGLGIWEQPTTKGKGGEIRTAIAPGDTIDTAEYHYIGRFRNQPDKFYVSVRTHFIPLFVEECTNTFNFSVYLIGGKKCDEFLRDIIDTSAGKPGIFVGARGAFTRKVALSLGQYQCPIRAMLGERNNFYYEKQPSTDGHHYLILNSLGMSDLSPKQIMGFIMQDPNSVFPYFEAKSRDGQQAIKMRKTFDLKLSADLPLSDSATLGDVPPTTLLSNAVDVTAVNNSFFTFTTRGEEHFLCGSATHGIFKDSAGELWLFQEGIGVTGEATAKQILNYSLAKLMWLQMARNVKGVMPKITPTAP
jgi:hypothetical protein